MINLDFLRYILRQLRLFLHLKSLKYHLLIHFLQYFYLRYLLEYNVVYCMFLVPVVHKFVDGLEYQVLKIFQTVMIFEFQFLLFFLYLQIFLLFLFLLYQIQNHLIFDQRYPCRLFFQNQKIFRHYLYFLIISF